MDEHLVQRTRYLLQTRFRRVRVAKRGHFAKICKQLLDWLENHPIIGSVIHRLDTTEGDHHQEVQWMLELEDGMLGAYYPITVLKRKNDSVPAFKGYTATNFDQHSSACLQLLRASIQRVNLDFYAVLAEYLTQESYIGYSDRARRDNNPEDSIDVLREIALRDLYEYLDEHLDGVNALNGLMLKYEQNAKWFQRQQLRDIIANRLEGETGERALALHLQQYIFNQGVEFVVEPASPSGKADLVLRDATGKYVIIDAKYIRARASRSEVVSKIAEGFKQVARYCDDFKQPEGFLAVFVNDDIDIQLPLEQSSGYYYFKVGGHIIYYVEINISDRPSASKSGKAKPYVYTADELIQQIQELDG
jgi:hypothetical protein